MSKVRNLTLRNAQVMEAHVMEAHVMEAHFQTMLVGCLSRGIAGICSKQLIRLNFVKAFVRKVLKTIY